MAIGISYRSSRALMSFWSGKRVLVTGGTGFFGCPFVGDLLQNQANIRTTARLKGRNSSWMQTYQKCVDFIQGDLTDLDFCKRCCDGVDVVMHAAGKIAGLPYNFAHPAEMLTTNILLDTNVIEG